MSEIIDDRLKHFDITSAELNKRVSSPDFWDAENSLNRMTLWNKVKGYLNQGYVETILAKNNRPWDNQTDFNDIIEMAYTSLSQKEDEVLTEKRETSQPFELVVGSRVQDNKKKKLGSQIISYFTRSR